MAIPAEILSVERPKNTKVKKSGERYLVIKRTCKRVEGRNISVDLGTMMNRFIGMVQKKLNEKAHVTGILITRWESTKLGRGVESQLRESLGSKVFTTKIRKNVSLAEAPYEVKDIVTYAPKSNGATDYLEFAQELMKKLK